MPKFENKEIHYDIVGSFLRPKALKEARVEFDNNKIGLEKFTRIQDQEIARLITKEVNAGLKFVTDGEFRRSWWHLDTFWSFEGIKKTTVEQGYLFHGTETRKESAQVEGKIRFTTNHPDLKAFKYLYSITKDLDVTARQSIPSPAQCYAELVRGKENLAALHKFYANEDDLLNDLGNAYHDLILALYDAGCRDLKLDDCTWGMVVDKDAWENMGFDVKNIQELEDKYLAYNNRALRDLPSDLVTSTHICRGNYASDWASTGGYEPVAKTLFGKENVDAFYLEFDDSRSGDFVPLKEVPKDKEVVLGLVTSKNPQLEDPKKLAERIKEASEYVPFDKLSLSTQCGFASTNEGNHLTEEEQWNKIQLVVKTAKEIWEK